MITSYSIIKAMFGGNYESKCVTKFLKDKKNFVDKKFKPILYSKISNFLHLIFLGFFLCRAELPSHVVTMLNNMPNKLHPMSQFSAAVTALNSESKFVQAYTEGVHKSKYWEVSNPILRSSFSFGLNGLPRKKKSRHSNPSYFLES